MDRIEEFLLNINYTAEEASNHRDKLRKYMEEILSINTKINLTSIENEDEFIEKHIIDSLAIEGSEELLNAEKILDLGTGGGFPGVPLAILHPEKKVYLIDAVNKKLLAIKEICKKLSIDNIETLHGRAEDLGKERKYRGKFDLVVSRAVANLATLSELTLPFVALGGDFIAYKGPGIEEEIEKGEVAIETLGGDICGIEESCVKGQAHFLLYINKGRKTPDRFPRKAGTPQKKPIE